MARLVKKIKRKFSEAQIAQQAKFKFVTKFLKPCFPYINTSFELSKKSVQKGMNLAIQYLLKYGLIGNYPYFSIDYNNVKFSSGRLKATSCKITLLGDQALHFTWPYQSRTLNKRGTDQLTIICYEPMNNYHNIFYKTAWRAEGQTIINLMNCKKGDILHLYYYFSSFNGKKHSDSFYAGEVEIK